MKTLGIGMMAALLGSLANARGAQPATPPANPPLAGKISEVTLYQGTAMVSRHVEIPADKQGACEIIIGPLPAKTDATSVFADHVTGAIVRSVACRSRPPEQAALLKGRAGEIEKEMHDIKVKITTSRNEIALRRIRQDYLKALQHFVAPAVAQEMTHGVIQSKEIEAVTQMHFREYETASQEIMKLDLAIADDTEALAKLKEEHDKLAAGPPVTYDAVVYLDKPKAEAATLSLNYLVSDCGWSPVYNVRGDSKTNGVEIEFNSLIHQVSGEDWNEAIISLSTASPKTSAYNPRLAPLYVGVSDAASPSPASSTNAAVYKNAVVQRKVAIESQMRGKSMDEIASQNYLANDSAAGVQLIELSERLSELRLLNEGGEEDLSIRYELATPVTLVSRRDAQMVPVIRHTAEAVFYHVAAPVLTTSVFREAELVNASTRDLLGGQVNVYLDGEFKGRTDISTIAMGRTFTLSFGVDGQLKARRTLVDRRDDVQGGNRQITITAEVVVENYKDQPVKLRIRERIPFMEDTANLRVSAGEMNHPLSADTDYVRYEKSKGILRWDLNIAPGSADKSTSLRYAYSLEFDKKLTLRDISKEQKSKLQREFVEDSRNSTTK
jgi:uncharacterized protein (TIGR02231 family)